MTDRGRLTARRGVIAAGEAYLPKVAGFSRAVVPMSSAIVLTEPLSPSQWREIGWDGGEGLGSQAYTVDYLTRTPDGRILYGSRGARYLYGSATEGDDADVQAIQGVMHARLREWFPVLQDVGFSHGWSGHLGVTRDWTPTVDFDAEQKIGRIYGYTGRGVSTSNLCARLLTSLMLDKPSDLRRLPIAQRRSPNWEPEPFRWAGIRYIQDAFKRMDDARDNGRSAPADAGVASWLSAPWSSSPLPRRGSRRGRSAPAGASGTVGGSCARAAPEPKGQGRARRAGSRPLMNAARLTLPADHVAFGQALISTITMSSLGETRIVWPKMPMAR